MTNLKPSVPVQIESASRAQFRRHALAAAISAAFALPHLAYALPTGGQVVSGSSTITQTNATTLSISQRTTRSGINWQGFNTASGESVIVAQPAGGVALYRVANPVEFFGHLSANGQIFLSSPMGVLFGAGSSVDVGGLTATTLSMSDADFNAGRYVFSNSGGAGSVVNRGTINAPSGFVALLGPQVSNEGIIAARMGSVALAAGDKITLDMVGDGLIKVTVDQAALNAAAMNKGTIEADGGNVLLTARSANALLDTVINTDGVIRANSIGNRNGTITLDGGDRGIVSVAGQLEAKGIDPATLGGFVKVLGQQVEVLGGANINVSGDAGGGTVLVGGDFQGKNPDIRNATFTTVAPNAYIKADAITTGDGGRIIVWSDQVTQFAGHISARGGVELGDGGFAEVSGKHGLVLAGLAGHFDFYAPKGKGGALLLDPNVINVTDTVSANACIATGTCLATGITTLDIEAADITAFLTAAPGNNLTLKTNNDGVSTTDNINITAATLVTTNVQGSKLTLDADDFVTGYGNIVGTAGTHHTVLLKAELISSVTKPYDSFNTVSNLTTANYNIHGFISGNAATITNTAGTYNAGKNVGTGLAVTTGTLASGDYSFSVGSVADYTVATSATGSIGAITKLDTNISGTRVYDQSTVAAAANLGTVSALIGGDVVTVSGAGTVATKNVGVSKAVTNGTLALGGADGANYNLLVAGNALTVTQLDTNISGTRVYDQSTVAAAANLGTVSALIGGDVVTVSGAGTVATKNVGVSKAVTNGTLALGGADGANYNLLVAGNALTVTQLDTNISGTRVYDQSTVAAAANLGTVSALIGGDVVTVSGAGTVATKNVGVSKAVTNGTLALGGADGANYNLLVAGNALTVTQLDTNISGTRVYDQSTVAAAANLGTVSALIGGDVVTVSGAGTVATKNVGVSKAVTNGTLALGGADGANYNLLVAGNALTVTQLDTNISGTRVYDQSTVAAAANLGTVSALIGGDVVTVSGAGTVATKNVGVSKAVTNGTLALGGADGANYNLLVAGNALTVTQLDTNISGTRVYDQSTVAAAANLGTVSALIGGDVVTVSGAGTVATKNVGVSKAVTNGTLALGGADGANYNLLVAGNALTVTAKPITSTGITATGKVYDANPTATLVLGGAVITDGAATAVDNLYYTGDAVTLNTGAATGAYANKNVGVGKAVTVSGLTLGGGDAANYTVTDASGATAAITQLDTNISGTRVYDQSTVAAAANLGTVSALIGGDVVTVSGAGTVATKNVGVSKAVTNGTLALGGADGANYNLLVAGNALTVTQLDTNISGTRVYDQSTVAAAANLGTVSALIGGDVVTVSGAGTVATKNVGVSKAVTNGTLALGGADGANYNLLVAGNALTVTQLDTNISGTRVYDQSTVAAAANLGTVSALIGGDVVTVSGAGTVATKNVGVSKAVTNGTLALGGADGANYNLLVAGNALTVTQLDTNISGTRVYDQSTVAAAANLGTVSALIGGDVVTVSGAGTVATKNVGVSKAVTNGTLALGGADGANYNLLVAGNALTVTQLDTNISGTRVYDQSTVAAAANLGTVSALIGGDVVTVSGAGTVATKNVGVSKAVTNGTLALGGADGANYNLLVAGNALTVTQLDTNISGTRVYDQSTVAAAANLGTVSALIGGDVVTVSGAGTVATKNVGVSKAVTNGTLALGGADGANYNLLVAGNALTVTQLDTNISGTRVYDQSTVAAAANLGTVSALIGGDVVTVSGAGTVATKNVGVSKAVTNGTLALGGADGANYNLLVAGNALTVTQLDTNISGTRVYDQSTVAAAANLGTVSALIGGDVVTVSGAGTVATKNVGVSKAVTNGTLALGGADGANYNLLVAGNALTVTQLDTNISGTRVYDQSTVAAAANLGTVSALIGGDVVTVSGAGTVATKNVGVSKAVTNGTLALGGADGANYNLLVAGNALTVTQLDTNISGTRVYDQSTVAAAANLGTVSALIGGDVVTVSGAGTVATKNVGVSKAVTNGTLALGGADGANYNLLVAGNALTVTQLDTNISGTRVYDQSTVAAAANLGTVSALIGGDVVTVSGAGTVATKNVGVSKAVTNGTLALGGADGANYNLLVAGNALTVTQLDTNISGTRVYDQSTVAAAANLGTVSALIGGDVVTVSGAGTVATKNVGVSKAVTNGTLALGGADGANYNLLVAGNALTVTQLDTNISGSRPYDGSSVASSVNLGTVSALIGGDVVTVSGLGSVPDKDVGVAKAVTNGTLALGGADGANYNLLVAGNALTITRLASVNAIAAGNWSSAGTWAGGAIPDKNNVAAVNLNGQNVTLDAGVATLAGSVQVDNITGSTGTLTVNANTLAVAQSASMGGYTQSAGTVNITNNLTVGTIGPMNKTGGTLTVGGTTSINVGANPITVLGTNDFTGAVSLTGGTTQISDINTLTLGALSTGALTVTSNGALNLGSGTTGALAATSNGGAIMQSGPLVVAGTANLQAGAGAITLTNASNDFQSTMTAVGNGGVSITDVNALQATSINAGPGLVSLFANSLVGPGTIIGGTGGTTGSPTSALSSNTNVVGGNILTTFGGPLTMTGAAANWNFQLGSTANPYRVTSSNINVAVGGTTQVASVGSLTQSFAIGAAQAAATAAAAEEAANTFGTDSVAEQVEYGFAGDVGTLPPMDHRLTGVGISVPKCFNESREGDAC